MRLNKELPKIAFGAWAWGNDNTFGNNHTIDDLKPVFEAGLKIKPAIWDTAFVYGMGTSEKVLGELLKDYPREDSIISTKFTPQCADATTENAVSAMYENSCNLIGTDLIDIYWIHNPVEAPEWTKKLAEFEKAKDIPMIGLSNHNLEEIKQAQEILEDADLKVSAIQNHYSLLNRSSETSGILDYCKKNNITFFSYMVLEQGALTGKYSKKNPFPEESDRGQAYNPHLTEIDELNSELYKIAESHDVNLAQIPIAWAINKETLPIVGVTKVQHVTDAIEASQIELTKEEIKTMEELADKANVNTIRIWEKEMK